MASQYFLELAKYVGLPVISWNADNAALEKVTTSVEKIETDSWFIILNISELLPTAAGSYHQTPGHGHHVTSPKVGQRVFGHFTVFFLNPWYFFFSAVKLRISLKNISPQSRPSRLVTSDKDQTALSNDSP